MLHLLRLRPSPEQIKEWKIKSGDSSWTAFLRSAIEARTFTAMEESESGDKKGERRARLEELFSKSQTEEDYHSDGCGKYRSLHKVVEVLLTLPCRPTRAPLVDTTDNHQARGAP